ncbi:MAG: AMP-binding protein [Pseudomonadota bacterium]|nr:AMP-binding protein [Pseudomonadota bacterium]
MDAPVKPPFRHIDWMERDIECVDRPDGSKVMRSRVPLEPYAPHIPWHLRRWAAETPDLVWLAQRRGPQREWRRITFAEAMRTVDSLTQALLDMGLGPDKPLAILSGNSLEHALITQAAMQARVPAAPISPAYSLMSQDHAKLKYIFELIGPGAVMVQDGALFGKALAALDLAGMHLIHVENPPPGRDSVSFETIAATPPTPAVAGSVAAIGPDTVGKLLFTSGSTGSPKGVLNTQRMMCANVQMMLQARRRGGPDEPRAVVLDWLPWNHTMGGNAMFNTMLAEGGMLYIDDGRPLPAAFGETLKNLREVSPTYYSNVPAGYAMLATALEADPELARNFFKDLGLLSYGGATLSDDLYERMQALAIRYKGERIVFFTGWGSTETAPTATATYWASERVGLIGLPYAGVELKLVPAGAKYELRIRGPLVTPGYYRQPDLTAAAFDEEGFYRIGDAGVFVDPDDPAKGLVFAGRVVEDFKLSSGTFVHVGSLRVASLGATSPAIHDAIVTGQDREWIGLLAWPNLDACRGLAGLPADAGVEEVIAHPAVVARVRDGLAAHNTSQGGSSMKVRRVLLMAEPPSIDGNELTDKGYINQRATLERRHALVERLYRNPPAPDVIEIPA